MYWQALAFIAFIIGNQDQQKQRDLGPTEEFFTVLARELNAGYILNGAGMMALSLSKSGISFLSKTTAGHTYAGYIAWRPVILQLIDEEADMWG